MCRRDAWATHAIAHVNEYKSDYDTGIKFLLDTESDWKDCDLIASHNYWHLALFHLEKNELDRAVDILDNQQMSNLDSILNVINASQLLLRIKFNNNLPTDPDFFPSRWLQLSDKVKERVDKRGFMYSDWHVASVLASCGSSEEKSTFWHTLSQFLSSEDKPINTELVIDNLIGQININEKSKSGQYLRQVNAELRGAFDAVFFYQQNEFDKVVESLYPIRDSIYKMGGSNAQRDIFNLLLIDSAFKSSVKQHNSLGVALLNERSLNKPGSELTRRIAQRFVAADLEQNN